MNRLPRLLRRPPSWKPPSPPRPRSISLKFKFLGLLALAGCILQPAVAAPITRLYQTNDSRPGEVLDRTAWEMQTPFLRAASLPFAMPDRLTLPPEPLLPSASPFRIDPTLAAADQQTLKQISEGLRLSLTGRRLYAYVQSTFAAKPQPGRRVTLTFSSLGKDGDRAVTTGTPPDYQVALNKELTATFGWQAMVPKLAHELVHIRDYEHGVTRCVAIEVSGHAADAAVTFEANMASTGKPIGPFGTLTSLHPLYERVYAPFRLRPSTSLYIAYWRDLMTLVTYERAYRNVYVDTSGDTTWNSPPGPPVDTTYVPYDPAYADL